MSQHSDLLTHGISYGIRNKVAAISIVADIGALLTVLEYEDDWCSGKTLITHVYDHARWMRTQTDGLYGLSHKQLDDFIMDVWLVNQWLPV